MRLLSWVILTIVCVQVAKRRDYLFNYMLFLRVTPTLPNTVINVCSPIVDIPYPTFLVATILGLVPATFVTVRVSHPYSILKMWKPCCTFCVSIISNLAKETILIAVIGISSFEELLGGNLCQKPHSIYFLLGVWSFQLQFPPIIETSFWEAGVRYIVVGNWCSPILLSKSPHFIYFCVGWQKCANFRMLTPSIWRLNWLEQPFWLFCWCGHNRLVLHWTPLGVLTSCMTSRL